MDEIESRVEDKVKEENEKFEKKEKNNCENCYEKFKNYCPCKFFFLKESEKNKLDDEEKDEFHDDYRSAQSNKIKFIEKYGITMYIPTFEILHTFFF